MYPNLKLQIWKTGLRQNRFAQLLGIDETTLSKIVNGFRAPAPELRKQMADLLESDEYWLFEPVETAAKGESRAAGSVEKER